MTEEPSSLCNRITPCSGQKQCIGRSANSLFT